VDALTRPIADLVTDAHVDDLSTGLQANGDASNRGWRHTRFNHGIVCFLSGFLANDSLSQGVARAQGECGGDDAKLQEPVASKHGFHLL
jgi:hypothetical protein